MKKTLALLLALLMLTSMLTGCSSTPSATQEDPTPGTDTSADIPVEPATEPDSEPAQDAEDHSAQDVSPELDYIPASVSATSLADSLNMPKGTALGSTYPICEAGEIELEYWRSASDTLLQRGEDPWNEFNYSYRAMEQATGIHINWNLMNAQNYTTQYSLMLVSEDYPDMASAVGATYSGGWEQGIEDDVYVDLAEYLEILPNFQRWLDRDPKVYRDSKTDNGMIPYFTRMNETTPKCWMGYAIRQNWLDDLSLEMPTTVDQWHDVLVAFKENKTNGAGPLDLTAGGWTEGFIEGAFGVDCSFSCGLILKDGKVESSYQSEGMRQYLELMSSWYAEGLVDPDYTSNWFAYSATRMANNESGMFPAMYTQGGDYVASTNQAEVGTYLSFMPFPVLDESTERHLYDLSSTTSGVTPGITVFATSDYVEEALRWCDYMYTEDGYIAMNYGIRGESYELDENGVPYLLDVIVNNPDGLSSSDASEHFIGHRGCLVFLITRELNELNEAGRETLDMWNLIGDWGMPAKDSLYYNQEESEDIATLQTDLDTYVSEFVGKVILGQLELNDDSWAEFLDTLERMNINEVIEVTQGVVDRYLQR